MKILSNLEQTNNVPAIIPGETLGGKTIAVIFFFLFLIKVHWHHIAIFSALLVSGRFLFLDTLINVIYFTT